MLPDWLSSNILHYYRSENSRDISYYFVSLITFVAIYHINLFLDYYSISDLFVFLAEEVKARNSLKSSKFHNWSCRIILDLPNLSPLFASISGPYVAVILSTNILNMFSVCSGSLSLHKRKQTPWPLSARELYPPNDRRLSAKFVPAFADRECHVISVTDPCGRILGFLDRGSLSFPS
jgi:hypothetical protein